MVPIQRTCDVENIQDFIRYYQNSWVGWHGSDASYVQPALVAGGGINSVRLRPLVKIKDTIQVGDPFDSTWENLKERIDFGAPRIGMMPEGPTILFLSYTTPRVARKGYRSRDSIFCDFNGWDIRKKYSLKPITDRYDLIWFAFNPEYKTLEQAEDILAKGEKVGVAISRTLGVYSQPKFKNSLLAYKRWTVGHVVSPYLIHLNQKYADYEEDIAKQTGAEVIVI